jgi:putative YhbY family RNA-binding protein
MPSSISSSRRSDLRAQAHKLDPVVIIGDKGLTDEVIAEIDRSLKAHELIKVRAATDDRAARAAWMKEICARVSAAEVQQIGKVLVIYRENPEKKPALVPAPAPAKAGARGGIKRTSRPRSRTPSPRPESGPRRRRPRSSR